MGFLKFLFNSLVNILAEIVTGVGFIFLLGGVVSQIWVIALAGAAMMIVGFFLIRTRD